MGNFDDLILDDGSEPLDKGKNDYFLVTVTGLKPGKTYPIEFRWNYDTKEKNTNWSSVVKVVTPSYAPDAVTNLNVSWANEIFTLSFTHDRSLGQNANVLQYKIKIVAADSTERVFYHAPKTGSTQVFTLEYSKIVEAFGIPLYAFSGSVIAIDKDGNESTAVTFPLTTATTSLPAPVITVASATGGYTVTYTTPSATTYPNYSHINVEEVESSAGSDPGSGYSTVFSGVANPVILSRSGSAQRWVRARFISKLGLPGAYSTAYSVSPTPAVVIDTVAPSAPGSGSLTAGIDNSSGATIGFNAYVDVSWSAVSDSTLRGYRLRFRRDGSSDPYSYVDSPGTGTSFRLSGLAIGTTYEIAVASYDEINNTSSSYTSLGTATATGTPFIGKNVTTQGYFGASASGDTGEFRFGYGVESGRRGLRFDANNYWYIDSSAAASFRLGGSANNYLQWNGSTFTIDGNLVARSGEFRGNVQIVSGSLFAGASASSGARLAISSTGLTAYDSNGSATTNIYGNAGSGGVTFTTSAGTIGNWSITNSSITKTSSSGTLTLDSGSSQIIATGTTTAYRAVLAAPTNNQPGDIVIYAGSTTPGSAPFRVRADGTVTMTSATITGYVGASDVANNIGGAGVTTITGDKVSTGIIQSSGYSGVTDGSSFSTTGTAFNLSNGTITSQKFRINTSGSAFFEGSISGSTITGGLIRTASSGASINISGSDQGTNPNAITFTNPSGSPTAHIVPLNIGGTTYGLLMHYGGTADSSGGSYPQVYVGNSNVSISSRSGGIGTQSAGVSVAYDSIFINTSPTSGLSNAGNITFSPGAGGQVVFGTSTGLTMEYLASNGNLRIGGNITRLQADGQIFANTLGTSAGTTLVQSSSGFIKVLSSSRRYKENIVEINKSGYLNLISLLKPVTFNYKQDVSPDDYQVTLAGLIAEDVQEIENLRTLVNYNLNGEPESISYNALSALLVLAIKEIKDKIESIEQRLDALEG